MLFLRFFRNENLSDMGKNKNAVVRYQALDRCFRNPARKYCIDDLLEACNEAIWDLDPEATGIRKRQLYDDINFMQDSRGYNAPIEKFKDSDLRKTYYRYSDKNFSINKQPLNEMEAQQLKESLLTLTRFKGLPQFEWVEEMKVRLEHHFKLKTEAKVISFEENVFLTGRDLIGNLYSAIVNRKVLNIEYHSFKSKSEQNSVFEIHPYHLKQYNNRWFLFGLSEKYGTLTNLALDRIKRIGESSTLYRENYAYDFEEFFEDVIGVSVYEEEPVEEIKIKVDARLWPYFETKPVHGSQKVKEKCEDSVIIQLNLIPNYEFYSQILSHGPGVEILEPVSVREKMRETTGELYKKYMCAD